MPTLNLDLDYFDHPKTKRLIGLLGKGSEVLPIRLWAYCGRVRAENGRLTDHSAEEIESIVGWWGKSGAFVEAMLKIGFLDHDGKGYAVHEWLEYQGHLWAFKVRAKKGARARWERAAGECLTDASSMLQASNKQCPNKPTNQIPPKPPKGGGGGSGGDRSQAKKRVALKPEDYGGFCRFWSAWPKHFRRTDKAAALKVWVRHDCEPMADQVIRSVERWRESSQWKKDGGQFVPAPEVWLNKRRWEASVETIPDPESDDWRRTPTAEDIAVAMGEVLP